MATQTHPYLVISDGTTTCTIQDGSGGSTNYPLVRDGWAPAIAGLRASPLEGYTPYEDVTETLTIEINGASATAALANLVTLRKLLEQAERWYRGENETAVLIKFAPQGSTVSATATPLQAAILGGAVGGAGVRLSPRWDEVGRNYVIPDVQVSIVRRGLWLQAEESIASSATDNGDLVTLTFAAGAQNEYSPVRMTLTNTGYGKESTGWSHGGYLLLGNQVSAAASIAILNAEGATATDYTSVVPAGSTHPRNTNVLRYTPSGTTETLSGALAFTLPAATTLMAVFANIRPSATVAFSVRALVSSVTEGYYTPPVAIPANSTQYPRWVFLGLAPSNSAVNVYLAITAAAASSSLDIDSIVICDARAVQVLTMVAPGDSDVTPPNVLTVGTLTVDHGLLTYPEPRVTVGAARQPYNGDAVFVNRTATVYGVLLMTGLGSSTNGDEYRIANTSTDALYANTWTLYRRPAYAVPQ